MKNLSLLFLTLVLFSCTSTLEAQSPSAVPKSNASLIASGSADLSITPTKMELNLTGRVLIATQQAVSLANADGGSAVLIHSMNSPISMMSLSPDETKFVYFQGNYLYVQDVKTGSVKQLNQNIIGSIGGQLKWSPDGKKIALSCSTPNDPTSSLCLIDADSGRIEILISQKSLGEINPFYFIELQDWSRDGSKIVFVYYTPSEKGQKQDFQVYFYDTSLRTTQMMLDGKKQDAIIQIRGATISPDEKTLLISGIDAGSSFQIFRMDLESHSLSQLTRTATYSFSMPVWGSDSSYFYVHLAQNAPSFKEGTAVLDPNGDILSYLDIQGTVIAWIK